MEASCQSFFFIGECFRVKSRKFNKVNVQGKRERNIFNAYAKTSNKQHFYFIGFGNGRRVQSPKRAVKNSNKPLSFQPYAFLLNICKLFKSSLTSANKHFSKDCLDLMLVWNNSSATGRRSVPLY